MKKTDETAELIYTFACAYAFAIYIYTYIHTHRPPSSSFLGLPYRILDMNPKKELLWVHVQDCTLFLLMRHWRSSPRRVRCRLQTLCPTSSQCREAPDLDARHCGLFRAEVFLRTYRYVEAFRLLDPQLAITLKGAIPGLRHCSSGEKLRTFR